MKQQLYPLPRRTSLAVLGSMVLLSAPQPAWAWWGAPTWPELKQDIRKRNPSVPQLSVSALRDWLLDTRRPRPLLLDVRPPEEFNDGHLEGAVRVASADEAFSLLRTRPKGTAAVLYCSVGLRSSDMAKTLLARGATAVFNLEGSLFEWANEGLPVVASRGPSGKVHPYNRKWGALLRRDLWSREV